MKTAKRRKVFVVDDHPIFRQGLAQMINHETDLVVCGDAESAAAVCDGIAATKPDIVILDISLKGKDGIDVLRDLQIRHPDLPVLMLSMHDESLYAERALRAGARGYVMKQEATEKVMVAIRRVLAGGVYVGEEIQRRLIGGNVGTRRDPRGSPLARLSDRELEIFRLMGQGAGTREIAGVLNLSVKTVESHQAHIKDKLQLKNSSELLRQATLWVAGSQLS